MFKKNKNRFLIKTPTGFESFEGIQKKYVDSLYTFIFDDDSLIKCSGKHLLLTEEGFKVAEKITYKNTLTNKNIKKIISEFGNFEVFDPVGIKKHASYYSNDVISHNTEFLGSTNTLISGEKLATISYKDEINDFSGMKIYEEPIKEFFDEEGNQVTRTHMYAMTVDVSEGRNLDYSAFSVFDVSTMPYKQVARFRDNTISPLLYPNILQMCAVYYNNAYVLIEINNNPQVAEILQNDLEYENVMRVVSGNKKAQTLSSGFGNGMALGLKMSPLVKRMGCSTLKTLIEMDKLIINDFETYSELTTFVSNSNSYEAEEGCNDDLAMTLVIFGWLSTQKYFKEIVDHDIRKQLQLEKFNISDDDDILPIIDKWSGLEVPFFVSEDTIWIETKDKDPYEKLFKELLDF